MKTVLLLAVTLVTPLQAQTELGAGVLLFSTPAGNIVVAHGNEGAFIVGPVGSASTAAIQAQLEQRRAGPIRYVIVSPQATALTEGDGGWQRLGAYVASHENSTGRWHSQVSRLRAAGADIPRVAYSEVIKFDINGKAFHAVHQRPGHSDADVLVHFEEDGIVYLGESYAGDGYPVIDTANGGTLEGLIQTLNPWAGPGGNRFVGARGPAAQGTDIRAFRDMLVAMRDRVRAMVRQGQTLDHVIAARPSAEFDARWGSGRVTPEAFVRAVYRDAR